MARKLFQNVLSGRSWLDVDGEVDGEFVFVKKRLMYAGRVLRGANDCQVLCYLH